jgi:cytochrome c-type biogenesis protein CcmH
MRNHPLSALLRAALLCVLCTTPALAFTAEERLDDPALEARAQALHAQLRCVVCQNESIASSNAPLARDLRRIVRERIAVGDSDEEVIAYVTARYGDFVRLRPPLRGDTLILWLGPLAVLLLGGGLALMVFLRARRQAAEGLSNDERRRLESLLDGGPGGRHGGGSS